MPFVSPRNVKISTFSNIFLKSYFFVVLLQPFIKDNKLYGKIKNIGGDAGGIVLPHWESGGSGKDRPKLAEQARRVLFTALDGCWWTMWLYPIPPCFTKITNNMKIMNQVPVYDSRKIAAKWKGQILERPINKGVLGDFQRLFPVLKVQGLNPCGITRDRRSQSIFEKSFDYRESSVKEVQSTIALLGWTTSSVPWGDASPKNTNWAGAPTSDYRKLQKLSKYHFLT